MPDSVNNIDAAGFVLVKRDPEMRFLILRSVDGEWDLPKGQTDGDENAKTCAKRETLEETGLSPELDWGETFITYSSITFFVGNVDDDPDFKPNPKTGVVEHSDFKWVSLNEALTLLPYYLKVPVLWAAGVVNGSIMR